MTELKTEITRFMHRTPDPSNYKTFLTFFRRGCRWSQRPQTHEAEQHCLKHHWQQRTIDITERERERLAFINAVTSLQALNTRAPSPLAPLYPTLPLLTHNPLPSPCWRTSCWWWECPSCRSRSQMCSRVSPQREGCAQWHSYEPCDGYLRVCVCVCVCVCAHACACNGTDIMSLHFPFKQTWIPIL